jgi:hypothetical protein
MADQDGDDADLQSAGVAFLSDEADLFLDVFDCCPDDPGLSARSSHTRKEITDKSCGASDYLKQALDCVGLMEQSIACSIHPLCQSFVKLWRYRRCELMHAAVPAART